MHERFEQLLMAARGGEERDFLALLRALQQDATLTAESIIDFCRSDDPILRRAGVELAAKRRDPEVIGAVSQLAEDREEAVRKALAVAVADADWWSDEAAIELLLFDRAESVRLLAVKACAARRGLTDLLLNMLVDDREWTVRQAVAENLEQHDARQVASALLTAVCTDDDWDVSYASAGVLEKHLKSLNGYPDELDRPAIDKLNVALERVGRGPRRRVELLHTWLEEKCRVEVDLAQVRGFGTVLTEEAQLARVPRAYCIDSVVESVELALRGGLPRAVVLLGPSGAGKTAIVGELAHRLAAQGWHLVRVAPDDFLTGTLYLGEWQTRLSKLIAAVRRPRPVVLYVPNLEQLSTVGKSSSTDSNVATAIAPYLERGDIVLLGESTEEAFQKGLGANPALRKLFRPIAIKPLGEQATRVILDKVAEQLEVKIAPGVLNRVQELAAFVNVSASLPGRAVELLRRIAGALQDGAEVVEENDILAALRVATGVPVELLDDTVKLNRADLREFFESRVMGQPEAIDAAVDLVTLIKAGLTDPNKPFGVLLFVGPTGVGKTELARALAEYCFGSASRLARFDMSEYATWEAYERLIGKTGEPGTLTSVVREQPFSILLFDELEKGHQNVYDLCLQIFDAGRLTDGRGQTADFRRTIIVLTSNVGAMTAQGAPIGFGQNSPDDVGGTQSHRDLRRAFRPEFLNRIDRIVQFHALSEETAGRIVRREVDRVLGRSGITRRNLSIDIDPSLMPLLLREGYSRIYGARPLKRAIERLILLPLARAIAAGEVRANSLIRLLVRNGSVRVQVHQAEESEPRETLAAPAPVPADLLARLRALQERVVQFREQVADLSASKAALLAQTALPTFWDVPAESQQVFEQIYVLDGVLAQVEGLCKGVQRLSEVIAAAGPAKRAQRHAARLDDLESYAAHVALLLGCREPKQLGDAVLSITRVGGQGQSLAAVERLATMYLKFARRRHFKVEVLDDHHWQSPPQDSISLLISGVGAHLLLATEQGLHAMSRGVGRVDAGEHPDREIVRVDVGLIDSAAPALGRNELHVTTRPLAHVAGRLMRRPRIDVQLLHPASMVSLRAWTDCDEQSVVERLMPLLQARINTIAQGAASSYGKESLVRRYRLGPSQLVRDVRTGRKSGRLDQVFDGHLDAFLVALAPTEAERP